MSQQQDKMQIREFADKTGVTVRALHHYDRLGLVRPKARTASGYRLYGEAELMRLQQVLVLKFIGCPLQEIKAILDSGALALSETLRLQKDALESKQRALGQVLKAIQQAERVLASEGRPDWDALKHIVEVIEMESNTEWKKKYFTPEQLDALQQRATPEVLQAGEDGWAKLIPEVEAAAQAGVDPASDEAKRLAERWSALVQAFTGGNPGILQGLNKLYAGRENWPAEHPRPYSEKAGAFINKAKQAAGVACG